MNLVANTTPAASTLRRLPVLLFSRGGGVNGLAALADDRRLALIRPKAPTSEWVGLSRRLAGTIVVTREDPLGALVYALLAGIQGTVVVASWDDASTEDVLEAGAASCIALPATAADAEKLISVLAANPGIAYFDTWLNAVIEPVGHTILCHDHLLELSQKDFELLFCLSQANGRPVSTEVLLINLWPRMHRGAKLRGLLEFYVSRLRRRLNRVGIGDRIVTVRGFGYALGSPSE